MTRVLYFHGFFPSGIWSFSRFRGILAFVLPVVLLSSLGGKLTAGTLNWDAKTCSIKATATDKEAEAAFAFTNTSANPVEIVKVRTSCGCTTAELPKKLYGPGESGSVKAVFTFGSRKGLQEKTLIVQMADGAQDVLTLRVEIPDSVKINKEMLTWQVGDPLEAQSFDVSVLQTGTKVKSARALGSNFEVKVAEIEAGKTYRVHVTPVNTDRPASGTVRLEVEDPGLRTLYFRVKIEP